MFFSLTQNCETGAEFLQRTAPEKQGECRRVSGRPGGVRWGLNRAGIGTTCEGAGPRGAGPISTHLRSPGLLPLAPPGCGAQRGESGAEHRPAVAAVASPLSLQPWGSLVDLSRVSSSSRFAGCNARPPSRAGRSSGRLK